MKLLVTGCGRGGTNLGIELVRAFDTFNTTEEVEDRAFFAKDSLPAAYATKLATENTSFTIENIDRKMKENPDLFLIFMLRHPLDICLSKILRGRPRSKGGDSTIEQTAADGTPLGAMMVIKHMTEIYEFLRTTYSKRLLTIKLEDLTTDARAEVSRVAAFLGVEPTDRTFNFHQNNRNRYQKARYGNELHPQVDLYKDLENNFEGIFKEKVDEVGKIGVLLEDLIRDLGYTL